MPKQAWCSFCRKDHREVGPLVEGPDSVYICGACIELCQSILHQELRRRNPPLQPAGPVLLRETLDRLISGQHEAKHVLAQAGSHNQGGRALLIGSSRSAAILLARALAYALDVPFAAGDSTSVLRSRRGSAEVLPLLFSLLEASDFDLAAAQRGVVFVDGAERRETQEALLRLWHENVDAIEGLHLAVDGLVFVCAGTFMGLDDAIGRSGPHSEQPVTPDILRMAGVSPKWADCLTGIARVAPLDEASLVRIVEWVDFRRCGAATPTSQRPVA